MDKVEGYASVFVFGIVIGYLLCKFKQVVDEEVQKQEQETKPVHRKPKLYVVKTQ